MADDALAMHDCLLEPTALGLLQGGATDKPHEAGYLSSRSKRMVDLVGASLLLFTVLPLLLFVSLLITTTSRGSSLFRQRRFGRDKSTFLVLKLRSMRLEGDASFQQAVRGDARVTWIGKLIRKTSIDELPQLLNVLKGEMSLVGPRPHAIEHDGQFASKIPGYDARYKARPGITGLAQISGARGATPTVEHMRRRLELDMRYIRQASFSLDCRILALTVWELLFSFSNESIF